MNWSADAKLREMHFLKLLNIVLNTQYNGDKRIDRLYDELVSHANKDRGFVNFDTKNTPFLNFKTADEELKNDDNLLALSALSDRRESEYRMRNETESWESINTKEERQIPPFVLKFACLSRDGNELGIDDPSYYKVFVKLEERRIVNLWDYATALATKEVDLDAHRRLFSILFGIQHLAREFIPDTPKIYVSNVNYDVPWLHFDFISGPVGDYKSLRQAYELIKLNPGCSILEILKQKGGTCYMASALLVVVRFFRDKITEKTVREYIERAKRMQEYEETETCPNVPMNLRSYYNALNAREIPTSFEAPINLEDYEILSSTPLDTSDMKDGGRVDLFLVSLLVSGGYTNFTWTRQLIEQSDCLNIPDDVFHCTKESKLVRLGWCDDQNIRVGVDMRTYFRALMRKIFYNVQKTNSRILALILGVASHDAEVDPHALTLIPCSQKLVMCNSWGDHCRVLRSNSVLFQYNILGEILVVLTASSNTNDDYDDVPVFDGGIDSMDLIRP